MITNRTYLFHYARYGGINSKKNVTPPGVPNDKRALCVFVPYFVNLWTMKNEFAWKVFQHNFIIRTLGLSDHNPLSRVGR